MQFLFILNIYSQVPNIDINIHDIQITDRVVSFRYTIRNESEIPVWFHKTGGGYARLQLTDNTLFIAPVYDRRFLSENAILVNKLFEAGERTRD